MSELPEPEREVVKLRYGLNGDPDPKSIEEVVRQLDMPREQVKRVESQALKRLARMREIESLGRSRLIAVARGLEAPSPERPLRPRCGACAQCGSALAETGRSRDGGCVGISTQGSHVRERQRQVRACAVGCDRRGRARGRARADRARTSSGGRTRPAAGCSRARSCCGSSGSSRASGNCSRRRPYSFFSHGDLVLASGSFRLRGESMAEFQIHFVYEFEDGRLVRATTYATRNEALAAMGRVERRLAV